MLRILEIVIALFCVAFSVYFGILGAVSILKYLINYHGLDSHEKVRGAKIRAMYFSLSAAGFFIALAIGLQEVVGLFLIPVLLGVIWLYYMIYRARVLGLDRPSK